MKNVKVALIVTIVDISTSMKIIGKDVSIFVDRPVLNGWPFTASDFANLSKAAIQEVNLKMECPSGHIIVEVAQIWILVNRFKQGVPSIVFCEFFSQNRLTRSDITGNGNVLELFSHRRLWI